MNNFLLRIIATFVIVILLCECNGTQVPLSPPGDVPVDDHLTGKWLEVDGDTSNSSSSITVYRFNEYEYVLKFVEDSDVELIRAYTTSIDDFLFANVQCLGCDDDDDYILFRYSLSNERILKVWPVRNDLYGDPQFKSSQALFDFIKDHMHADTLYEDEYHFRRAD